MDSQAFKIWQSGFSRLHILTVWDIKSIKSWHFGFWAITSNHEREVKCYVKHFGHAVICHINSEMIIIVTLSIVEHGHYYWSANLAYLYTCKSKNVYSEVCLERPQCHQRPLLLKAIEFWPKVLHFGEIELVTKDLSWQLTTLLIQGDSCPQLWDALGKFEIRHHNWSTTNVTTNHLSSRTYWLLQCLTYLGLC